MVFSTLFRDEWRGRPYLLSPALDFMMAGGGAMMALLLIALTIPYEKISEADVVPAAYLAAGLYWLAYAVNYPHFMVSYQLFYRNLPERLRNFRQVRGLWWRTVNAAILAPLALVVLLAYAVHAAARGDLSVLGLGLQLMFFTVGWHYVKQSFGVFIMLSALKGIFYSASARRMLLWNAYAVWLASFVYMSLTNTFLGPAFEQGFAGVQSGGYGYRTPEFPDFIRLPLLIVAATTTLLGAWHILRTWRETGMRPSLTALSGYLSMYVLWALVALLHPEWALAAPFFHSLQYLLFVNAYRRGELHEKLRAAGFSPQLHRRLKFRNQEFFAVAFLLGVLAFNFIPHRLDMATAPLFPSSMFVLVFVIFINVHHYFIDNVLWRKENPDISPRLLGWRKPLAPTPK